MEWRMEMKTRMRKRQRLLLSRKPRDGDDRQVSNGKANGSGARSKKVLAEEEEDGMENGDEDDDEEEAEEAPVKKAKGRGRPPGKVKKAAAPTESDDEEEDGMENGDEDDDEEE